jgi:hypothetical protein
MNADNSSSDNVGDVSMEVTGQLVKLLTLINNN